MISKTKASVAEPGHASQSKHVVTNAEVHKMHETGTFKVSEIDSADMVN